MSSTCSRSPGTGYPRRLLLEGLSPPLHLCRAEDRAHTGGTAGRRGTGWECVCVGVCVWERESERKLVWLWTEAAESFKAGELWCFLVSVKLSVRRRLSERRWRTVKLHTGTVCLLIGLSAAASCCCSNKTQCDIEDLYGLYAEADLLAASLLDCWCSRIKIK